MKCGLFYIKEVEIREIQGFVAPKILPRLPAAGVGGVMKICVGRPPNEMRRPTIFRVWWYADFPVCRRNDGAPGGTTTTNNERFVSSDCLTRRHFCESC